MSNEKTSEPAAEPDPQLTPTEKDGEYKDEKGRPWYWIELKEWRGDTSANNFRGWHMRGYCRPLDRAIVSTTYLPKTYPQRKRIVVLGSEYPKIKQAIATHLKAGEARLTYEEATKRRPSVSANWLRKHANKKDPLLGRVLTAPEILRIDPTGKFRWPRGFLPKDVDDLAEIGDTATKTTREEGPKRLTAAQAFKKYSHWVKDRKGSQATRQTKYESFVSTLKRWRKLCHWIAAGLDDGSGIRPWGRGGTKTVKTYDAVELALIDERMKASAEGIWFRTAGGEWFSAEQVRRGKHGTKEVREYVTIPVGANRHRIAESRITGWVYRSCVYRGDRIDSLLVKTFANSAGNPGHERVIDAEQLREVAAEAEEGYDKSECDNGDLAPASALAAEIGISKRWFGHMAEAAGIKPAAEREVRSGQRRSRTKLFPTSAVEKLKGKSLRTVQEETAASAGANGNGQHAGPQISPPKTAEPVQGGLVLRGDDEYPLVDGVAASRKLTLSEYDALDAMLSLRARGVTRPRSDDLGDADSPGRRRALNRLAKDPEFGRFVFTPEGRKGKGYAIGEVCKS